MATRMQQRRGTAAQWTAANPILAAGEIGFETDTSKFKMGNGSSAWSALQYFANAAELAAIVNGAPELLNTLSELATAMNNDPSLITSLNTNFTNHQGRKLDVHGIANTELLVTEAGLASSLTAFGTTVSNNLSGHASDTTNIHGIVDTTLLVTQDNLSSHNSDTTDVHGIANTANIVYAADLSGHASDTSNVHGIADTTVLVTQTQLSDAVDAAAVDQASLAGVGIDWNSADEQFDIDSTVATKTYADGAVSTHNSDTTDVHGIADTSLLATKSYADTAEADAITAAGTAADTKISTAVAALTKSSVGLGNVDNTSDANKPVSSATQTALDAKAPLAGPTFTGTVALPSTTSIGDVSATELGYLDGVTSSVQTQLTARLPLAGGTMTGALTLSGAPTSDLHAATKLYVDNVTAGINFHESVHAASVTNLAVIYNNGTSGVGATLTADTNRAFAVLDGETVVLGERVLIKNQTDAKQNGIYTLTAVGSVSAPWVLTRATDADNNPLGEMKTGDFTFVQRGTVNASVGYINNSTANPIVIGTDNISYTEFNAGKTIVAGSGLTEAVPGTLSIATGGITSAMIDDGAIVDADVNASAAIAQSKISGLTSDLAAKAPLASPTFTGTVTVAAAGVAFTDGTQTKEGVVSRTPIIQKTASYTLSALSERDSMIEMGSASALTLTVPSNATVAWPVGTSIDILQTGAGQVTIAAGAGVTVNGTPGLKLRTQWSGVTLFKRATDTWVVYGDLTA